MCNNKLELMDNSLRLVPNVTDECLMLQYVIENSPPRSPCLSGDCRHDHER